MKKILAAAALISLFSAVSVYAGSTELKIVTPSGSVQQGDTFEVEIDVVSNTGFTSFDGLVEYDPSIIRLVGAGTTADDTLYYGDEDDKQRFITAAFINSMVNQIPSEGDSFYDGRANSKDTEAAIGAVKLANYVSMPDSNNKLSQITGTGTLCTLKFEAVGSGTTPIEIKNTLFSNPEPVDRWHSDASASLTVSANGSSKSEATTEKATETTTSSSSKSSSGGSSGGGGGGSSSRKVSTTTEATTESTTETETKDGVVIEETVEATSQEAPAVNNTVKFNDLSSVSWAESYINDLASKGIVNGYNDGTFKPNAAVKRCDFVVMLAKALDLPAGSDNFSDVSADAYYASAVSAAKAAKIVNGNTDGTFAPDSLITRQDMMVIAKGALEYAGVELTFDESVLDSFTDNAQISGYARNSVAAMVSAGIVNGTGSNVEPKGNTTRAQSAVIISKICEKISK